LALVATVTQLGVSLPTLALGAVAFLVLMTLYVIFKVVPEYIRGGGLKRHAAVLSWTSLIAFVAVILLLLTSTFFNVPLPFKAWIIREISRDATGKPADHAPAPATPPAAKAAATSAQTWILADKRILLAREIQARKAKCVIFLRFLEKHSSEPNAYKVDGSRIYGPRGADGITFLELDSRYLPPVQEIDRLIREAGLDESTEKRVSEFRTSYARFAASVDDPMNKQHINVGVFNWGKFAREVTLNATFALCALDADLGETGLGSGPIPLGCAPVHK
jgi:hypothetical protein